MGAGVVILGVLVLLLLVVVLLRLSAGEDSK